MIILEEKLKEKGLLLCIIVISNNVLSEYDLDDSVRSRIGSSEIFFEPYSRSDVLDIIKGRLFLRSIPEWFRQNSRHFFLNLFYTSHLSGHSHNLHVVLEGYLDGCEPVIHGWAWDTDNPNIVVTVDIVFSGKVFQNIPANKFRKDLLEAGKGDGRHAFAFYFPHELLTTSFNVEAYFSNTKKHLARSPLTYDPTMRNFFHEMNNSSSVPQWDVENILFFDNYVEISGWALGLPSNEKGVFLLNGHPFDDVSYPFVRPDIGQRFQYIRDADLSGFVCRAKLESDITRNKFLRFDYGYGHSDKNIHTEMDDLGLIQNAWFFRPPQGSEISLPSLKNMLRVSSNGITIPRFIMLGFTFFMKINYILEYKFGKKFSDFNKVLDWGCGCGKLARYLSEIDGPEMFGMDVDPVNISWCNENIKGMKFLLVPINPPTNIAADFFDLIIGISVFTHLTEDYQFSWLKELRRISLPGALIIVTIHGKTSMLHTGMSKEMFDKVQSYGFVVSGKNSQISDVVENEEYYVSSFHSEQYIRKNWSHYFDILDIIPSFMGHHDLVIMKKPL